MRLLFCMLLAGCATDTTAAEARRLVEHGALRVDVRSPSEFAERHIPGSRNVPVEHSAQGWIPRLQPRHHRTLDPAPDE